MKVDELIAKAKESLEARRVYAEPYEKNGITVIPAASIAGGGGAGTGKDKEGQEGQGGGFGLNARPAGAYVIKDDTVRWEPAVDVNRIITTAGVVVIAVMLAVARIVRIRTDAATATAHSPAAGSGHRHGRRHTGH